MDNEWNGAGDPLSRSDGAVERGADVDKSGVDTGGQRTHAGSGREGDQSNHQRVFNQILTFFLHHQGLQFHGQLEQCILHLDFLSVRAVFPDVPGFAWLVSTYLANDSPRLTDT